MDALARAMAPIYYNLIYNVHSYKYEDVPAVYKSALDDYIKTQTQNR